MFWKVKHPSSKPDNAVEHGVAVERADTATTGFQIHPENRDLPVIDGGASAASAATLPRSYVIPSGYRISGSILTSRPVVVRGDVAGGSVCSPSVTVLPGGVLGASARVQAIEIHGSASGDIVASGLVEVSAQGSVSGEVQAPAIRVAPGAHISGASLVIGAK
jgi:cytoskeletal protein CcmA (bactofilin family)